MQPKFKNGDYVISSISPDIVQPLRIVSIDSMANSTRRLTGEIPWLYIVTGKHAVKGTVLTCRLEEGWLTSVPTDN